jgi:hypothetical protein
MYHPAGTKVVISSNPSVRLHPGGTVAVAVAVAVGVNVALAVAVAVAVAVSVGVAVAVAVSVAVAVAVSVAVAVAVAVSVAVAVAVEVAVGDGVGVGDSVIVIRPFSWFGTAVFKSPSIKMKLSGSAAQTNGLASPGVSLTLTILSSNNVPDPFNGVKSFDKADTRKVLMVPGPELRIPAATFQLLAVRPAAWTCGVAKSTTAESKVKSPWNAT